MHITIQHKNAKYATVSFTSLYSTPRVYGVSAVDISSRPPQSPHWDRSVAARQSHSVAVAAGLGSHLAGIADLLDTAAVHTAAAVHSTAAAAVVDEAYRAGYTVMAYARAHRLDQHISARRFPP